ARPGVYAGPVQRTHRVRPGREWLPLWQAAVGAALRAARTVVQRGGDPRAAEHPAVAGQSPARFAGWPGRTIGRAPAAILGRGDHSWEEVEKRIRVFQPGRRESKAAHFSTIAAAVLKRVRVWIRHYNRNEDR